jgi:hypothetical protein
LKEIIKKPPLSKFGIDSAFKFSKKIDLSTDNYYGYTKTNTHSFVKDEKITSDKIRVMSKICVDLNENDYL